MRRADRLFQIIQLLRRRRSAATAAQIAARLQVSVRTVYRDIRDLVLAGTPIDGEAGVGYRLRAGYDLPPMMFDREEVQALVLGARVVRAFGDPALAAASERILAKVGTVMPADLAPLLADTRLFSPTGPIAPGVTALADVRDALQARRKLRLDYRTADGASSARTVRPLGAFFWGRVWTLSAWCELRGDFRNFRIDRITSLSVLPDTFDDEPGKRLADLLAKYGTTLDALGGG